ncbi:PAS-domain containing protein [Roseibium salinum]|nr:PAS-domain containing protein [Roseibium salinum]
MEEQLKAQLDLMQAALDHINQGFSVFDANLTLVAWNRGLWEMLDFPQELARRGTHLEAFLRVNAERGEYGPGDIEGKIQRRLERAKLFEPHYFERIRPNGQVIAVSGTPLPQGGFVTTYSDVTEDRRRQEKLERTVEERTRALQQSEDWLRLVTDNIPALIAYLAPGPVFRFANRRYADWFGHSVASVAGRPAPEVVGEELFKELEPHIAHAFEGNAVSYEYRRKRSDGSTAYMRSTLIPDMTADGRTLGIFRSFPRRHGPEARRSRPGPVAAHGCGRQADRRPRPRFQQPARHPDGQSPEPQPPGTAAGPERARQETLAHAGGDQARLRPDPASSRLQPRQGHRPPRPCPLPR